MSASAHGRKCFYPITEVTLGTQKTIELETNLVLVTGQVQGVGFRFATVRRAHELGLTGWVRNQGDGSVQALLQGPVDQIDEMLSWLQYGPPRARVDHVDVERIYTDERRYGSFQQI